MAAANFLSQTVLLIFVFFAQILCRKSGPCFIERIFSRDREDQKKGRSKGQKKGRKGAVAKCIGHTISCTDIAVIRTGYRISRLFCDSPLPDDRRSQNGDTSEQKWGYSRTGGIARQDPIPCGICFWAYEDLAQRLAHHLRDRDPARCLARCRMEKGKEKKK